MERARERILIVDDHATNLEILRLLLGDQYELAEASSGAEALLIAPTFRPALVLLDIMMPGIDGYETCRRLRRLPATKTATIVMVSAKALTAERLQGYAAGADDYITKPFDQDELVAKVRIHLQLRRAEEVTALKSNVLELLSHELNTPLTSIKVPVELLASGEIVSEDERRMLFEMLAASVERLETLFGKVMLLCALLADRLELQLERRSLRDVVERSLTEIVERYRGRKIRFETDLADEAWVLGDARRLAFVVDALLDNAARFSPLGGSVVVGIAADAGVLRLTVTDEGEGMEEDFVARAVQPFACVDPLRHTGGHGLSLAIVARLVEAHGGRLALESGRGRGTRVTVTLPASPEGAAPPAPVKAERC